MTSKYTINLLQPELFPEKPLVSLPRVVAAWGFVFVVMLGLSFVLDTTTRKLETQVNSLKVLKQEQDIQLKQLKAELANHKADIALEAKLAMLQNLIQNKKSIYAYLTNTEQSYIGGYSQAMSELANVHSRNISLSTIIINDQQVTFAGMAKSANSVPSWLANFEQSSVLSGRTFNHFELAEIDNSRHLEFAVSSTELKSQLQGAK